MGLTAVVSTAMASAVFMLVVAALHVGIEGKLS